jgi:Acetyltransferase (GNAT) domain
MWQHSEMGADEWARLWGEAPMPLQQSQIYGDAISAFGGQARRLVWGGPRDTQACVQLVERRAYGLITTSVAFLGPHWCNHNLSPVDKEDMLRALQALYPKLKLRFLSLMPAQAENDSANDTLMKKLGLKRTITGYPTIWLDLSPGLEELRAGLKGKWRNALVSAEKFGVTARAGGKKARHYDWLLMREDAQRLVIKYAALPTQLVDHYADASRKCDDHGILSLAALQGEKRIAGQLFLLHGKSATYFVGWNGSVGRKVSAHNYLMWQALEMLKESGIRWLDLGGVNTEEGAGIARFKLGLGAPPFIYAGTYI